MYNDIVYLMQLHSDLKLFDNQGLITENAIHWKSFNYSSDIYPFFIYMYFFSRPHIHFCIMLSSVFVFHLKEHLLLILEMSNLILKKMKKKKKEKKKRTEVRLPVIKARQTLMRNLISLIIYFNSCFTN